MSIDVTRLVWDKQVAPPTKKLVLLRFADRCQSNGNEVWFYLDQLATDVSVSRCSAQRYVRELLAEGLISVTANPRGGAPGTKTHYRVNVERIAALPSTGPRGSRESTGASRKGCTVTHTGIASAIPHEARGAHQCGRGVSLVLQTGSTSATLNHPKNYPETIPEEINRDADSDPKTVVRSFVKALRTAGFPDARVTTQLIEAVKLGATLDGLLSAAQEAQKQRTVADPVAYAATVVANRLRTQPTSSSWQDAPRSAVEACGVELGVGKWDAMEEQWMTYKARVAAKRARAGA